MLTRLSGRIGERGLGLVARLLLARPISRVVAKRQTRLRAVEDEQARLATVLSHMADGVLIVDQLGVIRLIKQSVDLGVLVVTAAERLRPQAERQGVSLAVVPASNLPRVQVDPERIQQVVVNLLHNAVKFTPPGGYIRVAVERRGAGVAVSVADTGDGIAPEAVGRLFERFYKTDKARTGSGTGLGLAIAKHLVQLLGWWHDEHSYPTERWLERQRRQMWH